MINFRHIENDRYGVFENEEMLACGALELLAGAAVIRIDFAQEPLKDFFFRSMLNICAKLPGFIIKSNLDQNYLSQFGFIGGTVMTERIIFPKNCKGEDEKI